MNNAFKQITCTLIGTLLGMAVAGMVAPARAAANTWDAVKQADSDIC